MNHQTLLPDPDTHCFDDDTGQDVWSYSESQMLAYGAAWLLDERERCAEKLRVTRADVSLVAGELTAGEWRTCSAVLAWMQRRIRG